MAIGILGDGKYVASRGVNLILGGELGPVSFGKADKDVLAAVKARKHGAPTSPGGGGINDLTFTPGGGLNSTTGGGLTYTPAGSTPPSNLPSAFGQQMRDWARSRPLAGDRTAFETWLTSRPAPPGPFGYPSSFGGFGGSQGSGLTYTPNGSTSSSTPSSTQTPESPWSSMGSNWKDKWKKPVNERDPRWRSLMSNALSR